MKKSFFTLLWMMFIVVSAGAQTSKWSFTVGINPGFGELGTQIRNSDKEVHDIDYKQTFGINAGFEWQGDLVAHMTELRYIQYKYDKYELSEGEPTYPLPDSFGDLHSYSLMQYTGLNFMAEQNVQIPFYLGIGAEYLDGLPYHNFTAQIGGRIRVKIYFSDHFGIFGGLDYILGMGVSRRDVQNDEDKAFLILTNRINYDLGFYVTL